MILPEGVKPWRRSEYERFFGLGTMFIGTCGVLACGSSPIVLPEESAPPIENTGAALKQEEEEKGKEAANEHELKREKGMEPEPNHAVKKEPAPAEYLPIVCEGRWNEEGCTACPSYTWEADQKRSVSVSTPVALSLNGSHFGFNLEDCGHHTQHNISSVEIGRTENGWMISDARWTDYSQCKNHITADTLFQACPSIEEGLFSETHTMHVQSVRGFQYLLRVSDNLNACPEGPFTNQEFIGFNFVEGCVVIKYREGDYTTDPKDSCEQTLRSSQDVERRFCWNGDEFSEQ